MDAVACQENDAVRRSSVHSWAIEKHGIRLVCSADGSRSNSIRQRFNQNENVVCRIYFREHNSTDAS